MTSIYEEAAVKAREEALRLKNVYFSIISREDLASSREKYEDLKPRGQMVIEWEPLSYRKEGGKRGNVEFDFYAVSFGLDEEQYENAIEAKYRGIPQNRRMTIPKTVASANQAWQRFMLKAKEVGIRIEITDDGDFQSPDVGQVYRVEAGFVTLPTFEPNKNGKGGRWTNPDKGENGREAYLRLPVANITETYVQPEDVPVRIVNSSEDESLSEAPVTASAGNTGGVSAAQLAAAFAEAGIVGSPVSDFSTAAQQMKVTTEAGARAPILFLPEIQQQAQSGNLINYAVEKGAVTVDGDVIMAAA